MHSSVNGSTILQSLLKGSFPEEIRIAGNPSTIPSRIVMLTNLTEIAISLDPSLTTEDSLGGTLPTELWNLTKLRMLNITATHLTGSLLSHLGRLSDLVISNLQNCKFTSSIPPDVGNLTKLTSLDFSQNRLFSSLPENSQSY